MPEAKPEGLNVGLTSWFGSEEEFHWAPSRIDPNLITPNP